MTEQTIVDQQGRVQKRYVEVLGARVRIEITDEPAAAHRFRAVLESAEPELPTMAAGAVIGWGKTAARARRRAVDKIATRRRGPASSSYRTAGVTFATAPNPEDGHPMARAFIATVSAVDDDSPLRGRAAAGMVLAHSREASHAADRAVYVLGQWAEQARLAEMQRQLVTWATVNGNQPEPAQWDDGALCRETDPDMFFPEPGSNAGVQTAAASVCSRCEVQVECLARALDNREPYGIWGGTTETTRRALLRHGIDGDTVRARGTVVLALVSGKAPGAELDVDDAGDVLAAA